MRSYMIEDITPARIATIKAALNERELAGPIDDIFFLPVPLEFLSEVQAEHVPECGPYIMALETGETWLKLELLVRARSVIRCGCIAYASPELRSHMMGWLDGFIRELDIPV